MTEWGEKMDEKEKVPQNGTLYKMAPYRCGRRTPERVRKQIRKAMQAERREQLLSKPLVREWDAALLFHVENLLLRGFYTLGIDEMLREQLAEACDRMLAYVYQTGAVTLSEDEAAMILDLHTRPAWPLYKHCMQHNPHIAHSRCTHTAESHREKATDMCTPSERNDTEGNPPVLKENP